MFNYKPSQHGTIFNARSMDLLTDPYFYGSCFRDRQYYFYIDHLRQTSKGTATEKYVFRFISCPYYEDSPIVFDNLDHKFDQASFRNL